MNRRECVLAMLVMLVFNMTLHAQNTGKEDIPVPFITWGARFGFAATGTYITDAFIDGHTLTEYTQDTQVGNFAAMQIRLNSKRLLIQSGIGLSFNKSSFTIDKNSWNPESEERNDVSCSYSMLSITTPVQFGFHIVNRPPYCMSAFTGPRLRYTPSGNYSVKYTNLDPYTYTESPAELVVGWTAGLSVQTGRTFLDFEYEATINNISGTMRETSNADPAPICRMNRRIGIRSFSYGIMF